MGVPIIKTGFIHDVNPEEEKVAILTSFGYSDRDIAKLLSKSFNTVRNQKAAVYLKLGVKNTAELAMLVYQKVTGVALDAKDFIIENGREIASIVILCIYLSGHFNCDIRRPRQLRSRRQETELIFEEV